MLGGQDDYEIVGVFALDLERDRLTTRADDETRVLLEDWNAGLLGQENRITLVKRKTRRVQPTAGVDSQLTYYDVGLALSLMPDVKCQFVSTTLKVDFSPTGGAVIRSMAPLEVIGQHPVELETKIGAELKFEVTKDVLSAGVSPELSQKRTVYYPEITGSGEGTKVALWRMVARGGQEIRSNRDLRILVSAPLGQLAADFRVRADVAFEGLRGRLPFIGRGKDEFTGQLSLE
jgi:hypothetical protein